MVKYIQIILLGVIFSFYIFPIEFTFLPAINTKMVLAVLGLFFVTWSFLNQKDTTIPRNILILSLLAGVVSLIGHISVAYNQTPDYAYANYIISMWVWLSAAFAVCRLIISFHGVLSIRLICNYFIGVCVCQCLIALLIDFSPNVKVLIDTYVFQNQDFLTEVNRLYGIGAAIDTSGIRFAAALIIIMFLLCVNTTMKLIHKLILISSYFIIFVVGNMMSRTTILGLFLGIIILFYYIKVKVIRVNLLMFGIYGVFGVIGILLTIYLYHHNDNIHDLLRFGFEPFFNYIEYGRITTDSTDMLLNMYVLPKEIKTWIIGDGYFENPYVIDFNYLGVSSKHGFYMGTDVGYLRFIYYFGMIGLIAFSYLMIYAVKTSCDFLVEYRVLLIVLLLCGFVVWLKVSTDMFFLYALFLCVANMQDKMKLC